MKKIILILVAVLAVGTTMAQKKKKDWSKVSIDAPGDHLLVQISSDHWAGAPDSISSHMKGFSRGLNMYFMLNKPFKTDPRWSVAFGLGIGSSNIFFKKMDVNLNASGNMLPFTSLDSTDHFKKYKLTTAFLELPVELRYTFNPENEKKSWKIAIGAKVGTILSAHTKGKSLQNKYGTTLNNYIEKENKRNFLSGTRVCGTARVGIGNFSLFGSYQVSALLKDGAGPVLHPFQIGLCLSGL